MRQYRKTKGGKTVQIFKYLDIQEMFRYLYYFFLEIQKEKFLKKTARGTKPYRRPLWCNLVVVIKYKNRERCRNVSGSCPVETDIFGEGANIVIIKLA